MARFNPGSSGIASDRSANCAILVHFLEQVKITFTSGEHWQHQQQGKRLQHFVLLPLLLASSQNFTKMSQNKTEFEAQKIALSRFPVVLQIYFKELSCCSNIRAQGLKNKEHQGDQPWVSRCCFSCRRRRCCRCQVFFVFRSSRSSGGNITGVVIVCRCGRRDPLSNDIFHPKMNANF